MKKMYAMYLATEDKLVKNSQWETYLFTDAKKCNKMCDMCYWGWYSSGHCITVEVTKTSPITKYCIID